MIIWLFTLMNVAFAAPPECAESRLSTYTLWNDKVDRKIVRKHSVGMMMPWSPDSAFDGVLVKADDPADEVVLQMDPDKGKAVTRTSPLKVWEQDPAYRRAEALEPRKILNGQNGSFTVTLKKAGKALCETSFALDKGD